MKFLDEAVIFVSSGNGGNGAISFLREKNNPRGGPDGGAGGNGGNIVFRVSHNKNTLIDFEYNKRYLAANGIHGAGRNKDGANGANVYIDVPVGVILTNADTGSFIVDLCKENDEFTLFKGGHGGKGNASFCTPTRRSPVFAEDGEKGQKMTVKIDLKLLADVGLVGLPNVGKSTIISRISAAKAKIADYPFTTLVPNIGVVKYGDKNFSVADVPGLIKGASDGIGLGIQFLKHVERARVLLHIVDVSLMATQTPVEDIETINNEFNKFSEKLADKKSLYVLNKIDSADEEILSDVKRYLKNKSADFIEISAVTGIGLDNLLRSIDKLLF